jgi:hypothetical protein
LPLANLLPQVYCQQVEQVRGFLNVNVPYKFIGQMPTMLDIGLTVADKLGSVHLDPAAQHLQLRDMYKIKRGHHY